MSSRKFGSRSLVRLLGAWRENGRRGAAYRALADALRVLVLDGRLPVGMRLPGERELAAALGVGRVTVATAFALLRDDGYLVSRRGSGCRTSLPQGPGASVVGMLIQDPDEGMIDLAAASMPATAMVHAAYAAALAALPEYLPQSGYEPVGLPVLRALIAEHYSRRGLPTSADQILVTHGAQSGFALLLRMLTQPGDRVIVDHPTYAHAIDAILRVHCVPVPVGLPEEGWDEEALAMAARRTDARLAYLIPDFHNPTGRCMDEATRAKVATLLAAGDTLLVVDETLADLWFEAPPPPPLAAFAPAASVVSLGSTSKSFWGGLRVGWIRAEARLIDTLSRDRVSVDLGTPVLEQLAAAHLLEKGDEILAERRDELRLSHALMLRLIREKLPDWRTAPAAGGITLWAEMPAPIGAGFVPAAAALGVRIVPGSRFGVGSAFERFVRLPVSRTHQELTDGVSRLARAYLELGGGRGNVPPDGGTCGRQWHIGG